MESADEIRARRKAAAQTVSRVRRRVQKRWPRWAMLEAKPAQQIVCALAENVPPGEAGAAEPP